MSQTPSHAIIARRFLSPSQSVVVAAEELAREVIAQLDAGGDVAVDFRGVRGVSSAYFNAFFQEVSRVRGVQVILALVCQTDSEAQRQIIEKSRRAVAEAALLDP